MATDTLGTDEVNAHLVSEEHNVDAKLPVKYPTLGEPAVDVQSLLRTTGLMTYDPGFYSTANCRSAITYIDGDKGELLYRGYPIDSIANNSDLMETSYLLLNGELPTLDRLETFRENITYHTMIHEQVREFFRGFRRDAHPMAILCGVVGALAAFYHDQSDMTDSRQREIACHRLIAKMPTITAMALKYSRGQPFIYPRNDLNYVENFLHMTFSVPCEEFSINPVFSDALERVFILHADHEQNASTATVRMTGSSGANPFACIAAGIASLWGPLHGGANEAVVNMLDQIGTRKRIPDFIARAKDKEDSFLLMGFGHRVYKNFDPRATILQATCRQVFDAMQIDDPVLELAVELENIARSDEYFIERNLYPNVDFYSGLILRALGFPTEMFTPLFAVARTIGWVSQWREMIEDSSTRIGRPRQLYVGAPKRQYVPLSERS